MAAKYLNGMKVNVRYDDYVTLNVAHAKTIKVKRLRFHTGTYVHEVDDAYIEWISGTNKIYIRYGLTCGDVRKQHKVHIDTRELPITCKKCKHRASQR